MLLSLVAALALAASASSWGQYDSAQFDAAQRAGQVILLQFTDGGCSRCDEQEKVLSKMFWGSTRRDWSGFQVDLTRRADVARLWRVSGPSTLVLLHGAREIGRRAGVIVESELDAFLREADLPEPHGRAPVRPKRAWPPRP